MSDSGGTNKRLEWAVALITFGQFVADIREGVVPRKTTLVLSLPRIDFAAAFLTVGVIKNVYRAAPAASQLARLEKLKGHWVSFVEGGRTKVGVLERIPEDSSGQCSILYYKRKLPDFASMSAEERMRYTPPKSGELRSLLRADKWPSIKAAGRDFDSQKGARRDQVKRAARQQSRIQAFNREFGTAFGDEIMSSRTPDVSIFGNLTRIHEEVFSPLFPNSDLRLADIMRPNSEPEYAGSAHCSIAAGKNISPSADSVVILETGRCLADHLAETEECHRVILLGRNSPNYSEGAELALNAQSRRHVDDPPKPPFRFPCSVEYLFFYQK